jgi:glycosyltransferase involved in cell wall biosynthesis
LAFFQPDAMAVAKLRVLTISKPYVAATYRKKLKDLAAFDDLQVGLICPYQWGDQAFEGEPDPSYWTMRLPIAMNGKNHFHFYYGLKKAIASFQPDLINIEEEHYSVVTAQVNHIARSLGIKTIFYTWQNIFKKYPWPFSSIEKFNFRTSSAAICGNHESREILLAKGFSGKIFMIPQMGVDTALFGNQFIDETTKREKRKALNLLPNALWLSYMGRLVEEKGLSTLVTACAELKKTHGNFRLLVIGDGPYKVTLNKLIQEHGLAEHIILKPSIPTTDVPQWLQAMDALILPSLTRPNWKEQFGRILVEAMASSVLTIGSTSGEIPHVIGKAGLIFQEGDASGLAGILRKLFDQAGSNREKFLLGHKKVSDHYSSERIAAHFRESFLQVVREL